MPNEKQKKEIGLIENSRGSILFIFVLVLLIWGPIEPLGMPVRIAYLIILPIILYFALGYFIKTFGENKILNERLIRGLAAILAGGLLVAAISSFTSEYHSVCDQEVRTRDGSECVGDYVTVKGPDLVGGFFLVLFGGASAWYSIKTHQRD